MRKILVITTEISEMEKKYPKNELFKTKKIWTKLNIAQTAIYFKLPNKVKMSTEMTPFLYKLSFSFYFSVEFLSFIKLKFRKTQKKNAQRNLALNSFDRTSLKRILTFLEDKKDYFCVFHSQFGSFLTLKKYQ